MKKKFTLLFVVAKLMLTRVRVFQWARDTHLVIQSGCLATVGIDGFPPAILFISQ